MEPTHVFPTTWIGRRPVRFLDVALVLSIQAASLMSQVAGLRQMNLIPRPLDAGDTPLVLYYAGFVLQIAAMFTAVAIFVRQTRVSISDDDIRIGQRCISRKTATAHVAFERRFGRSSRRLQISAEGRRWQLRAGGGAEPQPAQRPPTQPSRQVAVILTALDFDEIVAVLCPQPAALPEGVRVDLSPYRASALGAFGVMRPWFVTILVLSAAGPTLGPLIVRWQFGPLIMPPLCFLGACIGIFFTLATSHRPRRGLRAILGSQELTLMDMRTGQTVAAASRAAIRATRVHYALFGRGDRWTNPGLQLEFPGGYKVSLAMPLLQRRWPARVPRSWAPRWTIDLHDVPTLLTAFGLRP